jgi:hypothetical protein
MLLKTIKMNQMQRLEDILSEFSLSLEENIEVTLEEEKWDYFSIVYYDGWHMIHRRGSV